MYTVRWVVRLAGVLVASATEVTAETELADTSVASADNGAGGGLPLLLLPLPRQRDLSVLKADALLGENNSDILGIGQSLVPVDS